MRRNPPSLKAYGKQDGIALIVVLILLLVMTLLGLASLRGALLEERMSANLYDRSLSFQAAEAALREAEVLLRNPATRAAFPAAGCTNGLCATPDPTADDFLERADDPDFQGWRQASAVSANTARPDFFIEYMGDAPNWFDCYKIEPMEVGCMSPRYRITARSVQADRAAVVIQSSFAAP